MKPEERQLFLETGVKGHPMFHLTSPRLTPREKILKKEVDSYHTSEIEDRVHFSVGKERYQVNHQLDLPDTTCDGLTFKLRLVELDTGTCFLLARWKPDRYMRRASAGRCQKWFIEKQVFPKDKQGLFTRFAGEEPIDFPKRPR